MIVRFQNNIDQGVAPCIDRSVLLKLCTSMFSSEYGKWKYVYIHTFGRVYGVRFCATFCTMILVCLFSWIHIEFASSWNNGQRWIKSKRYRDKRRSYPEKWEAYRENQTAVFSGRRNVLKVTETEAMKRKRKYRDSKKKFTVKLDRKREPTQVNTAWPLAWTVMRYPG